MECSLLLYNQDHQIELHHPPNNKSHIYHLTELLRFLHNKKELIAALDIEVMPR